MPGTVHIFDHPLVQHKLTLLRKKETSTTSFRRLLNEIGSLMAYEVTRQMPMHEVEIETPLEKMTGHLIDGKKLVFVPILRAGTGLLDGFLSIVPGARVGRQGDCAPGRRCPDRRRCRSRRGVARRLATNRHRGWCSPRAASTP